jgi:hypothetical protein
MRILIFLLTPINRLIAWVLNKTLGNELPTIFSKRELMKIIEEHAGAKEEEKECNKLVFAGSELF